MKDYKKILEGVVNIISTTEKSDIGFSNICAYIGENCPELKESEDDRIRKIVIEIVDWYNEENEYFMEIPKEKVMAWLEKQGEQKSSACSKEDEKMLDSVETDYLQEFHENLKKLKGE